MNFTGQRLTHSLPHAFIPNWEFILMIRAFFISLLTALIVATMNFRGTLANATFAAAGAAQNYARHCASCHGKDGRAKTIKGKLKHARNLTEGAWQEKVSDERIFNAIMNGKGKMPAYSKKLSEQEIEALVSYVRALRK